MMRIRGNVCAMRGLSINFFSVAAALFAVAATLVSGGSAAAQNRVVILDATNSMWGPIEGGRKYQIARDAVAGAAANLSGQSRLGLYVIGNQPDAGCEAINEAVPLGPLDRDKLDAAFDSAIPDRGRMPLFPAIERAVKAIQAAEGDGRILVIGDGAGTCVPDACTVAKGLSNRTGSLRIDAVALDADADTRERLKCMTDELGGSFLNAKSRQDVRTFVQTALTGSAVPAAPRPRPRTAQAEPTPPVPAANPFRPGQSPKVTLRAVLAKGRAPIEQGLAWRVMESGESADGAAGEIWRGAAARPDVNLPPGRYRVEVRHGLVTATREIEVRPRRAQTITVNLDAAVLNLSAAAQAGGEPLDDIFYYVERVDANAAEDGLAARASRPQPSFILPAGRYRVVARHGLAEAEDTVALEAGAVLGRSLALNTGTVRVKAVLAEGEAAPQDTLFFVHARNADGEWAEVLRSALDTPAFALPEGEYRIEARLDAARSRITIQIAPGNNREELITLPAGRLRLETRLEGRGAPAESGVVYEIFRLEGGEPELILKSAQAQFERFLPEGRYRVVSTYGVGNAVESQEISIEAGQTRSLSFVHAAGRAQIGLVKIKGGLTLRRVDWSIRNSQGEEVYRSTETVPEPHLQAGQYVAIAQRQGETVRSAFTVSPNQTTVVELVAE